MYRKVFFFLCLFCGLVFLGTTSAFVDPSPPPFLNFCGVKLPLSQELSYYYYNVADRTPHYWPDHYLHFPGGGEFRPKGGVFLKFDSSRLPRDFKFDQVQWAKILLVLNDALTPPVAEEHFTVSLYLLKKCWRRESFAQDCRLIPCLPDVMCCECYGSPEEIPREEWPVSLRISAPDWAGGKWVFEIFPENPAEFLEILLRENNGIYLQIESNESVFLTAFGARDLPAPALKAVLFLKYQTSEDCIPYRCGDGICDQNEECEEDCALPEDLDVPLITTFELSPPEPVNPESTLTVRVVATDPNGIRAIDIYERDAGLLHECQGDAPCVYSITARELGLGRKEICVYAKDNFGNISPTRCKSTFIGTRTEPVIFLEEFRPVVHVTEILSGKITVTDPEKITEVRVRVSTQKNRETALFQETFHPQSTSWGYTLKVPVNRIPSFAPEKLFVEVSAYDEEGMVGTAIEEISLTLPVQTRYGFWFRNFSQDLYYAHFRETFGDENVFTSLSICVGIPIPNKCWDNWFCDCYLGTPGSWLSEFVHTLFDWLVDEILDILDIREDIYAYFGIEELEDLGLPKLEAIIFYPAYHIAASQGDCTGFTFAASNLAAGRLSVKDFCSSCDYVSEITQNQAAFYLGHRQGTVVSAEFIDLLISNFTKPVTHVLRLLQDDLARGFHPGVSITGFPEENDCWNPTGHTLLVDRIALARYGKYRIYVYDSNRPTISGQAEDPRIFDPSLNYGRLDFDFSESSFNIYPYIEIDPVQDEFSFLLGYDDDGNQIWWTRGCLSASLSYIGHTLTGATLLRIPPRLMQQRYFTLPISPEGLFTIFIGNAAVTVEDSSGHQLSLEPGEESNGIPGAAIIPIAMNKERRLVGLVLPNRSSYRLKVRGNGDSSSIFFLSNEAGHEVALFGKKGSEATLSIKPLGKAMELNVGASASGEFEGALVYLVKTTARMKDLLSEEDREEINDDALLESLVPVVNVYSFKGKFSRDPLHLMPYRDGGLYVEGGTASELSFKAISTKPSRREGPFFGATRNLILPAAAKLAPDPYQKEIVLVENPASPRPEEWGLSPSGDVDLKINGRDGTFSLTKADPLWITVSVEPGLLGPEGDYFLWARLRGEFCYCYAYPNRWNPCSCEEPTPAYQGALVSLQDFEVFRLPDCKGLPPGSYEVFFAVDSKRNGKLDFPAQRDEVDFTLK